MRISMNINLDHLKWDNPILELVLESIEESIKNAPIIEFGYLYNMADIEIFEFKDNYITISAIYHDVGISFPGYFKVYFDGYLDDFTDIMKLIRI